MEQLLQVVIMIHSQPFLIGECFATAVGSTTSGIYGGWFTIGTGPAWVATLVPGQTTTLTVSIRKVGTTTTLGSGTIILDGNNPTPTGGGGGGCCFPAGCTILMADGTSKLIETVIAGDVVMGMGKPVVIEEITKPLLGRRRMMSFTEDPSMLWSEEHAMWTKDTQTSQQWWWSANADMWKAEAKAGIIGGLKNNETMRSSSSELAWAHLSGWKSNSPISVPGYSPNTILYLPRTNGSPIIVNGYVVGAGVNENKYEYSKLNWDDVCKKITVAKPTIKKI
jgi:hypothetical protein